MTKITDEAAACLNCGTPLAGPHCHSCGQRARVHRTLRAFFHDLVHGVLHFEGKVWRTLPLLVWHPGRLTREYIDGRRASYVGPIALFLFVIFLTFALWSVLGGVGEFSQFETRIEAPNGEAVSGAERAANWLDQAWREAKADPALLVYKLQTNAYKLSWLLIPLSLPFMWLMFPFSRRFRMYDHTVFVTYSISFMTMLVVVASLGAYLDFAPLVVVPLLYAPIHLYRQLRGTYGLGRFGALWRLLVLSVLIYVVLAAFVLLMIGVVIS